MPPTISRLSNLHLTAYSFKFSLNLKIPPLLLSPFVSLSSCIHQKASLLNPQPHRPNVHYLPTQPHNIPFQLLLQISLTFTQQTIYKPTLFIAICYLRTYPASNNKKPQLLHVISNNQKTPQLHFFKKNNLHLHPLQEKRLTNPHEHNGLERYRLLAFIICSRSIFLLFTYFFVYNICYITTSSV